MHQQYVGQIERLLEISRQMIEIKPIDSLLDYIVDMLVESVGAERGFVILTQQNGTLQIMVKRSRGVISDPDYDQVSASVVKESISTGQPLILADALNDPRFKNADSVVGIKLRSIMCAPLATGTNRAIGALYVENRSVGSRFAENDLALLTRFASHAAVAIENATIIDDLETEVIGCTRKLEEFQSDVVKVNLARQVWLSNMAHDLRAPLGIAVTALSLLQDDGLGSLNQAQKEWIGKSLSAIQHSNNLINDIFFLFTLESGGFKLQREETNLREFLGGVYDVARGLSWEDVVSFELELHGDLPAISIDRLRIGQVLLNLLSNAHKFTEQGQVVLHATPWQDGVLIGVRDTGEGIAADRVNQLFQRFEQADPNSVRRRKGSGLGLAICRELVEAHGGRIWVESTEGEGSDFLFSLPPGAET
jgi:signal transduction histidine kinase